MLTEGARAGIALGIIVLVASPSVSERISVWLAPSAEEPGGGARRRSQEEQGASARQKDAMLTVGRPLS